MAKTATAEKAKQDEKAEMNIDEMAKKIADLLATDLNMEALKVSMRSVLKELGYEKDEISDELILKAFQTLPADKLDPILRNVGLVPTPGFFASVLGWHNVEHLRSKGWKNKVAGAAGIIYQGAAIGLAAYLGIDWYRGHEA